MIYSIKCFLKMIKIIPVRRPELKLFKAFPQQDRHNSVEWFFWKPDRNVCKIKKHAEWFKQVIQNMQSDFKG